MGMWQYCTMSRSATQSLEHHALFEEEHGMTQPAYSRQKKDTTLLAEPC